MIGEKMLFHLSSLQLESTKGLVHKRVSNYTKGKKRDLLCIQGQMQIPL